MNEKALKRSIKKLTAIVTVIGTLLIAGGFFIIASLGNMLTNAINTQMASSTLECKINIRNQIDAGFQILQTLASFTQRSTVQDIENLAEGLHQSSAYNDFIRMGIFQPDGTGVRVVADREIEYDIYTADLPLEAQDAIGCAMDGEATLSRIYQDTSLNRKVFVYCVPLYGEDEKVAAVLAASADAAVFESLLDNDTVLNGNGYLHLIGSEGDFLVRSNRHVIQETIDSIFDGGYLGDDNEREITEIMDNGESGYSSFRYEGREYRIYLEPLGLNGWYLFCVSTVQGSSSSLYQMILLTRVIFIALLVLVISFILFSYRLLYRSYHRLSRIAYYDSLTGAGNTLHFMNELRERLEKPGGFCVVAMNIRQFKFINELFGKEQADFLLCEVKQVLDRNLREGEFFCRDSADLFFLFMEETERETAAERLRQIMLEIREDFWKKHYNYQILLYCGAVMIERYVPGDITPEELRTHTLFAMKTANGTYQNKIWFYDTELHKTELLENYVESHMHQALEKEEFKLYFQPKFELKNGTLYGAEALVRWIPADGHIIYPDQFISLFEGNGFCTQLDMYMFRQVCRQIRAWMDQGLEPLPVSINQSKLLFYEEGYVDKLTGLLEEYDVPASLITLEILEGLALENAEALNQKIIRLQAAGFRISMDDFGSGYSSLNTLGRIQINELKLDRAFLMEVSSGANQRQYLIMEEIVSLARKLGIQTVAEGVENETDVRLIQTMGCDCGQGYYYSRPISAAEFNEKYMKQE